MTGLIERLRELVGPEHVLTEGDLSAYLTDWRKRVTGRARAVVRPATTEQVAAVVRACAEARVPIVAQGGNTGMVEGSIPDASGTAVVLSLGRLNRIRAVDAANLTMTVDGGCVLQVVQEAADAQGLLFPLSLAAEGSCTIGGNLATNAGGTQVLRYGNARDLCLGIEVVTATGDVLQALSGLRKDNTGYDLRNLFIGSEGTLGIITGATLKLYPRPRATLTAWALVPSLDAAVSVLGRAQAAVGAGLTAFELMNAAALQLVARHMPQLRVPFLGEAPWCVLLEQSDPGDEAHARTLLEDLLQGALEDGCISDVVLAENVAQAHALWHIRESIPLAQAEEGPNLKHDISLPVSAVPAFCAETDALLQRLDGRMRIVNFGHLGDGNLHYNVQGDSLDEARIAALVYDQVAKFGGSISAEHGVGALKAGKLANYKSGVAMRLMRDIKAALDPLGILNPGKVLPSAVTK